MCGLLSYNTKVSSLGPGAITVALIVILKGHNETNFSAIQGMGFVLHNLVTVSCRN